MAATDLKALLKRAIELAMPDFRAYCRMPVKGVVVKTYDAADGRYWADVQPCRNDESIDDREPVIPRVEIPIFWGGPQRGLVCPPLVGTRCVVNFFGGDPNYPFIAHFRWHGNGAPDCEVGGIIIQRAPGTHIKVDAENNIIHITPADALADIGGDKQESVGGSWTIQVAGEATIQAPTINLRGNLSAVGSEGGVGQETKSADTTHTGSYQLTGPMTITGNLVVAGTITAQNYVTGGGE